MHLIDEPAVAAAAVVVAATLAAVACGLLTAKVVHNLLSNVKKKSPKFCLPNCGTPSFGMRLTSP